MITTTIPILPVRKQTPREWGNLPKVTQFRFVFQTSFQPWIHSLKWKITQEHEQDFSGCRYPWGSPKPLRTTLGPATHSWKDTSLDELWGQLCRAFRTAPVLLTHHQVLHKRGKPSLDSYLCWAMRPSGDGLCLLGISFKGGLTQRQPKPYPRLPPLPPLSFPERCQADSSPVVGRGRKRVPL